MKGTSAFVTTLAVTLSAISTGNSVSAASGFASAYAGESAFLALTPGQSGTFTVFFANTGTTDWVKGTATQVDLAACLEDKISCDAQDVSEAPFNAGWLRPTRYATQTQATVRGGQVGTFSYIVRAPAAARPAVYRFNGDLVVSATGERVAAEGYYQDVQVLDAAALVATRSVQTLESGFGTGTFGQVGYAVRLKNLSTFESASVTIQVALYGAAGTILKATQDAIGRMGPTQEVGFAATGYLTGPELPVRMSVQVVTEQWAATNAPPVIAGSPGAFIPGTFSSKVTGTVSSTYPSSLNWVRISAIGYDASGRIVGGGASYVTVPAGGSAPVEISYVGAAPTRAQIFAHVSCVTNFAWC